MSGPNYLVEILNLKIRFEMLQNSCTKDGDKMKFFYLFLFLFEYKNIKDDSITFKFFHIHRKDKMSG